MILMLSDNDVDNIIDNGIGNDGDVDDENGVDHDFDCDMNNCFL